MKASVDHSFVTVVGDGGVSIGAGILQRFRDVLILFLFFFLGVYDDFVFNLILFLGVCYELYFCTSFFLLRLCFRNRLVLCRALFAGRVGRSAVVGGDFLEEVAVLVRIRDDGRQNVVLGRQAHHGKPPDVDVFDALLEGDVLSLHGFLEGIQVEDCHVDVGHALGPHVGVMCGVPADGQKPAVDFRVQGLDAAVKALGAAGEFRDVRDGKAGLPEFLGGASGAEQFRPVGFLEGLAETDDPRLVRNADEGAFYWNDVGDGCQRCWCG